MRSCTLLLALLSIVEALHVYSSPVTVHLQKETHWFQSSEARRIIENVLAWQTTEGSWPKNVDTTAPSKSPMGKGTFDNGATVDELRFLARAFVATNDERCKGAFFKGFDLILKAQYPSGGWPQSYPHASGYQRHITFNDGTMVRLMNFLREVSSSNSFKFVDGERREAAAKAFDRGIECILNAQNQVKGVRTAWCAQHDEVTLAPRPARAYELISLSGAESVAILDLLMSLPEPSPELISAVDSAVAWFDKVKVHGVRQVTVGGDKRLIEDPTSPPLWARFYEIETNRPFFCGRDGVKKYSLAEIESERRNGYAWYGSWAKDLGEKHLRWKERLQLLKSGVRRQ
ncbi:MAG TPA: pectate lyase [Candidatus Kapabacteria bacterium]|nr:pectate lyase [Candidatus Kapabacteria bacterium]